MPGKEKVLLSCIFACTIFSASPREDELAKLPAITIQLHNNSVIQTKYAKLHAEASCGLWIAFDNITDSIYYKIIQEDNTPSFIDIESIKTSIESLIEENEEMVKESFGEIINFQNVKYYYRLLKNYFSDVPLPTAGDISAGLLDMASRVELEDHRKAHIEVDIIKSLGQNSMRIEKEIMLWQKKYDLGEQNVHEIDGLLQTIHKFIETHPLSQSQEGGYASFSFDIENTIFPRYHTYYPYYFEEWQRPHIIQFAGIKSDFIRKIYPKQKVATEYETMLNAFFFLPPIEEQYGNIDNLKKLEDKMKNIETFFKKRIRKDILQEGAGEKIKEHADQVVSTVVKEIKKQQVAINKKIDKVCEKLKSFLS